jgi:hypothetical protein
MADLLFPELSSGALVQYPVRKGAVIRTIQNALPDGSMLVSPDAGASKLVWQLSYIELPLADVTMLQSYFDACRGRLRGFTFIDPTDNLLTQSADITQLPWVIPAGMTINSGLPDPLGGNNAFTITNTTSASQDIAQALPVAANYQYCFSIYATAVDAAMCSLVRSSTSAQIDTSAIGPGWSRLQSSGRLNDAGANLTVAIRLPAGQTLSLFGPQLDAQITPSRFRPTYSNGGIHANAHWAVDELVFNADGPNLFSTTFAIEASIAT